MPRLLRFLLRIILFLAVLFLLLVGWIIYDGSRDGGATTDIAVVLGAAVQPDGEPGPVLKARLDRAAALYKAGKFPVMILASGSESASAGNVVVNAMVNYLQKQQIPPGALLQDPAGTSPDLAAHDVVAYMKQAGLQSVMVVTHYYEVTQQKIALKREGAPQITQEHVGTVGIQDMGKAATSAAGIVRRYAQFDAMPQSKDLIGQMRSGVTSFEQKVLAAANREPDAQGPLVEAKGLANFNAPTGWTIRPTVPGSPYPAAAETAMGAGDAVLSVIKTDNSDSLDTFVGLTIMAQGRRILTMDSDRADDFTTYAGAVGRRAGASTMVDGVNVVLVEYFFVNPHGGKIIFVGRCLGNEADRMKPLFDASVRSMKLE